MIPYIQAEGISKRYADSMLFENISFTVSKNSKTALIAKNGAGKSTLMDILAGNISPDSGRVTVTNDISTGYLRQSPALDPGLTVLEQALKSDNPVMELIREFEEAIKQNDPQTIAGISARMDELHAWDSEVKVKQILSRLKIDQYNRKVGELSGGQQKRVALANVLANEPDILLLDEPTNHLDIEMIEWLENYLAKASCTLLMVTHDRYFLNRVCNEIIEIDRDSIYSYRGNYEYYLTKRRERLEQQEAATEKARNLLRTEQEWMNRMPQARSHKAKYRIEQFHTLKEKAANRHGDEKVELQLSSARMGGKVVNLDNISKAYGQQQVISNFSYKFARYEKVGIIGNNGTGKTTLLNIIDGAVSPDSGGVDIGQTIKTGYYRQEGIAFNPQDKVIDVIKNIAEVVKSSDNQSLTASQLLSNFLFPPEMHYSLVEKLSGGERRRLYLCTILMQNPNFLMLDEPTNDLDIMTLNILEDYLTDFKGCVIIVSHDRFFMDRIVDHLFVFEDDGIIRDFPGDYTQYREMRQEQEKPAGEPPVVRQRIKPDKLQTPKLTFRERKELEQLEVDIELLEAERRALLEALNSGLLSPDELMRKSKRYSELEAELEAKEQRWLELSETEG